MIGRTVSHYHVERRLGAGGMGEVYLARDLALGRAAALKVLPEGFAPELRARLLYEAQASARLQHPAIATFYEAGEADGAAFIAMEYVRGATLRERLKAGALPADEALTMAACVLGGLAHAHAAGILHRDIKPENIMLTDEQPAKLLDFGLAKPLPAEAATDTPTATALTANGLIVGTVGYMSPEQLRGEHLDARSDVFATAAVLYEAISGRPAFPGATATERLAAILSRDPAPLVGQGVPPELWPVLSRALAREAARRHPSAAAFLSDLDHLRKGGIVTALPDTLAVLDLENLSADAADNWLGSGIAESLATDLAHVPGLGVVPREKVVKARAALPGGAGPVELGLLLGCAWVLSGSFQKMGPALRVTTHLTEIPTGRALSSEKIDGRIDEVFQIQDRLAQAVASSLNLKAPTPEAQAPALGAYECYARGRRLFLRLEKGSFDQARELYEQAVAQDSSYAPALAALSGVHAMRFTFTSDPAELDECERHARRAIEADETLAEPHVWLGYALQRKGRFDEALEAERQAMALDPSAYRAPYFMATAYLSMRRAADALPLAQKAVESARNDQFNWLALGWSHYELGHLAEARWSFEQVVEIDRAGGSAPTAGVGGFLGEVLRRLGELSQARTRCLEAVEAAEKSDNMYRDIFRPYALCVLGRTALQQGDLAAAHAAFGQAASHLRGRPRVVGGGHVMVQALAGLARAGEGLRPFEEALELQERREGFSFLLFYGCADHVGLLELARAARVLGRTEQAEALLARAREAGSLEAASEDEIE